MVSSTLWQWWVGLVMLSSTSVFAELVKPIVEDYLSANPIVDTLEGTENQLPEYPYAFSRVNGDRSILFPPSNDIAADFSSRSGIAVESADTAEGEEAIDETAESEDEEGETRSPRFISRFKEWYKDKEEKKVEEKDNYHIIISHHDSDSHHSNHGHDHDHDHGHSHGSNRPIIINTPPAYYGPGPGHYDHRYYGHGQGYGHSHGYEYGPGYGHNHDHYGPSQGHGGYGYGGYRPYDHQHHHLPRPFSGGLYGSHHDIHIHGYVPYSSKPRPSFYPVIVSPPQRPAPTVLKPIVIQTGNGHDYEDDHGHDYEHDHGPIYDFFFGGSKGKGKGNQGNVIVLTGEEDHGHGHAYVQTKGHSHGKGKGGKGNIIVISSDSNNHHNGGVHYMKD